MPIDKLDDDSIINNTSSSYTTKGEDVLFVDSSTGEITITLASSDVEDGHEVTVIDTGGNASNNNITIDTEESETIDGESSISISVDYSAAAVACDGNNWFTAGGGSGSSFWNDDDLDNLLETSDEKDGIQVDRILGKGVANNQTVAQGETVQVPSNHSVVVVGPYEINGTLQIDGTLKIL